MFVDCTAKCTQFFFILNSFKAFFSALQINLFQRIFLFQSTMDISRHCRQFLLLLLPLLTDADADDDDNDYTIRSDLITSLNSTRLAAKATATVKAVTKNIRMTQ